MTTWTRRHPWALRAWTTGRVWTRKVSREVRYRHLPLGFELKLREIEIQTSVNPFVFPLAAKMRQRLQTQRPECPPKPPDLAQRVRSMIHFKNNDEFTPEHRTDVTQSMCFLPSDDGTSPTRKTRKTCSQKGSFDDLDIPFIDEDEALNTG